MSILIKGMKMPKNCDVCPFNYDLMDCMAASHRIKLNFETRPKECPLVDVEAKGRLILNEQTQSKQKERGKMCEWFNIKDRLPDENKIVILAEKIYPFGWVMNFVRFNETTGGFNFTWTGKDYILNNNHNIYWTYLPNLPKEE